MGFKTGNAEKFKKLHSDNKKIAVPKIKIPVQNILKSLKIMAIFIKLAETGWVGAFWPHMKIAKPKFPIYIIFDPILALKRVQMGSNLNFHPIWL